MNILEFIIFVINIEVFELQKVLEFEILFSIVMLILFPTSADSNFSV
jgi:hypothetical protein